jgi:hypothetical protein
MVLDEGNVKELAATPPPSSDRVPMTTSNRQGIVDPLTALLFSAAPAGEGLSQEACRRTLPILSRIHPTFHRRAEMAATNDASRYVAA